MTGKVIEASSETWPKEVLEANRLVMVFFWADWCEPCLDMQPAIAELARENEDDVKVVQLNVDDHAAVALDYRVSIVPTVMFFREGKKRREIITKVPKAQLEEAIASL